MRSTQRPLAKAPAALAAARARRAFSAEELRVIPIHLIPMLYPDAFGSFRSPGPEFETLITRSGAFDLSTMPDADQGRRLWIVGSGPIEAQATKNIKQMPPRKSRKT